MQVFFDEDNRLVKTVNGRDTYIKHVGGEIATGEKTERWIPLDPSYNQLCVFQDMPNQKTRGDVMIARLAKRFSLRLRYAESVSKKSGNSDILFYVHRDDIGKLVAGPKKKYRNIKWFEEATDALPAQVQHRYPKLW